jgi:eukaryotic-like serine/threonine-protein kinase
MNVIDSKNISYKILEKLGEGSQGVTYLLEDKKHIVKLFNEIFNSTETKSKINFLISLGLDKKIFAIPLRQITHPKNGYIAEFASGMIPLSDLKLGGQSKNLAEWYFSTGGLQKRYNILIQLSALIRALHSKGLAYCDLSPNNIFISEKVESSNVFLIDLDNLRYRTSLLNNIYTPFYGAPEVISRNAPNTTMSDSYSFAVIAYELLTLNHPLIGDYVNNGEPDLEADALGGKIPWVDHSTETINERSTGLPSENVIPRKLLDLFKRNFEDGLTDPLKRPSMAEWFDALNLGLNELLKCGNNKCNLNYPYNNRRQCTFCGYTPNKVTRVQMRRWEEIETYDKTTNTVNTGFYLEPTVYDEILIDENTPKEIAAFNFLLTDTDPLVPVLKVELLIEGNENKILLSPLRDITFTISPRSGITDGSKQILLSTPKKIRVVDQTQTDKQKYMLHLKDLSINQRVLTID